jgi:hypothetical protein
MILSWSAVLQAVEAGCVPVLLHLVTAASAAQACAAAGALMMVSLSKQAKVALHEVRGCAAAIKLASTWLQKSTQSNVCQLEMRQLQSHIHTCEL